jgi:hypothetical protein
MVELWLTGFLDHALGPTALANATVHFDDIEGHTVYAALMSIGVRAPPS